MKKLFTFLLAATLFSCGQPATNNSENSTAENSAKSVTEYRDKVDPSPVATYDQPLDDKLNNWRFTVKLSETKQRFRYLLDMQYQEVTASDTIGFPNFGMEPQPEIRNGDKKLECIIGFLDKNKNFREYLKVYVEDEELKIKTLKHYAVYEK